MAPRTIRAKSPSWITVVRSRPEGFRTVSSECRAEVFGHDRRVRTLPLTWMCKPIQARSFIVKRREENPSQRKPGAEEPAQRIGQLDSSSRQWMGLKERLAQREGLESDDRRGVFEVPLCAKRPMRLVWRPSDSSRSYSSPRVAPSFRYWTERTSGRPRYPVPASRSWLLGLEPPLAR